MELWRAMAPWRLKNGAFECLKTRVVAVSHNFLKRIRIRIEIRIRIKLKKRHHR
jgi:hypothetical protein